MYDHGRITEWNDERGFGFITSDDGGKKVFVHIKSFTSRRMRPLVDDIVSYNLSTDARGRFQADNVSYIKKSIWSDSYLFSTILFLIVAVVFLVFVAVSAYYEKLPFMVFGYYIIISGVTFFAYSLDKSAAKNKEWRLREDTLHILSLLGGWPGALAAQVLIRHKSKKISFRIVFWGTVALNSILLGAMFTDYGVIFLRNTLGLI